jgi:hypothetical protein
LSALSDLSGPSLLLTPVLAVSAHFAAELSLVVQVGQGCSAFVFPSACFVGPDGRFELPVQTDALVVTPHPLFLADQSGCRYAVVLVDLIREDQFDDGLRLCWYFVGRVDSVVWEVDDFQVVPSALVELMDLVALVVVPH